MEDTGVELSLYEFRFSASSQIDYRNYEKYELDALNDDRYILHTLFYNIRIYMDIVGLFQQIVNFDKFNMKLRGYPPQS